ncbi:MAG: orotidine-5'-phosphate decarboxylase [Rhodospirillaceae bacterium]|nr:orotidine-5'-phosphate decarboxylase [Rhodospirillaceae bacterium]|tara:strand:+ start:1825 stop:2550 length:726 start_codon:yes stop_codon:yes gene_type:complete
MTDRPDLPVNPVFAALDTPDLDQALTWADALRGHVGGVKAGLEFFSANGADGVRRIVDLGLPLFLDLKFHDIPNTVAGAVRAVADLGAAIVNVHAAGGPAMLAAAREAAEQSGGASRPLVVAVTVLTSLDDADLTAVGQAVPARDSVVRLAKLAQSEGLDGVVCSPAEITAIRAACGNDFKLIVPGIRPNWAASGDQKRITTPTQARDDGADILIIGRPITGTEEVGAAASRIASDLGINR